MRVYISTGLICASCKCFMNLHWGRGEVPKVCCHNPQCPQCDIMAEAPLVELFVESEVVDAT